MKTLRMRRHAGGQSLSERLHERARGMRQWSGCLTLLSLVLISGCATSDSSVKPKSAGRPHPEAWTWSRPRFSPDGTRLAAFRNGSSVFEFALPQDLAGREVTLPFVKEDLRLIDLQYSGAGDLLLLCQVTNELRVWNARKGTVVAHQVLRAPVIGGLLSRSGQCAVVYFEAVPGKTNKPVTLVRWASGGGIVPLPDHRGIQCLAFSADGSRLATVDEARLSRLWNTETGALLQTLPLENHPSAGIALDGHGASVAVAGRQTRIESLGQQDFQSSASVANAAPKAGTVMGGVGVILLEVAVGLGGGMTDISWDPHWFKSAPTFGLCLSDDGKRVAMINPAPNMKDEFQIRLADTHTGKAEFVAGLSSRFLPWEVFPIPGSIWTEAAPGDRTPGQPVFSPDGLRVAVPGNGVRVLQTTASAASKPQELWLAKCLPGWLTRGFPLTADRHEIPYVFNVAAPRATNSASSLARAPHRRVCFEQTLNVSSNETWVVPLGLGMKDVFFPNKPIGPLVNEALRSAWQDCGHELGQTEEQLYLSSKVTKWQLEVQRSLMKGWDLTATIEIELDLKDRTGTVLHTARYAGQDHQPRLWEPSAAFIAQMHSRALTDCLAEMKNDPKWGQVLAAKGLAAQ